MKGNFHVRFGERGGETHRLQSRKVRSAPTLRSGVFLVLVYRRLIEKELQKGNPMSPNILRDILMESIYGVERELDACFVTEFSLILTLLHYVKPSELHKNREFQFPSLHNQRIFEGDFFESESPFSEKKQKFDWIIGNPPWVKATKKEQLSAGEWIDRNSTDYPVGDKSVAEAFSWRVKEFLQSDGLVGLLMPATSLVNVKSKQYRQRFFSTFNVQRITNFANLREVLFDKRGTLPAATFIYQIAPRKTSSSPVVHYGPFSINQVADGNKRPWVITINENEIQIVDLDETLLGETETWKLALWGNQRDKRAIERLRYLYPNTLESFCQLQGWGKKLPREGAQLRYSSETEEIVEYLPDLKDTHRFNSEKYNDLPIRPRFFVEPSTLEVNDKYYLRKRGGRSGLEINKAPHIFLHPGWNCMVYSEQDFIVQPRQMGISASDTPQNKTLLKALAAYLNSSLVTYYLFFNVPEWGFFRQRQSVVTTEVRRIPVPNISPQQSMELADLYDTLASFEQKEIKQFVSKLLASRANQLIFDGKPTDLDILESLYLPDGLSKSEKKKTDEFSDQLKRSLQDHLDQELQEILNLPTDIYLLSKEFTSTKLALDTPSAWHEITAPPSQDELLYYAKELRDELDSFSMKAAHHRVSITYSDEFIECKVEITNQQELHPISLENIQLSNSSLFSELRDSLQEPFSQWAYIQRGLRVFDGPNIYIYKPARRIDWTRTQALQDATDIINSVLVPA
ncbi:MAG: hypothetical protein CL608_24665 [Anaerolineaceae bacterium]|nr:hypothetical protein [Anaerolineaceae bacterium]